MPAGQSHTTWFPELIAMLEDLWDDKMTIPEQFDLVKRLNEKLDEIRVAYNVKLPMIWCPKCQARHEGKLSQVTITAMYYSLRRFDICSDNKFKAIMKTWKVYSRENGIDINGNPKKEKATKTQHHV